MAYPRHIFLIRHGQSEANVDNSLYCRQPDHKVVLTDLGWQQAREAGSRLAAMLNGEKIRVYQSPFARTRQTADGVLSALSPDQITKRIEDPQLREQEFGNYQDLSRMDKIDRERKEYGIFFYRIPNGESGADVYSRGSMFLESFYRDLRQDNFPQNALIVTHGLTLRLLLMRWFHWPVEYFEATKNPENCELVRLDLGLDGQHYELSEPLKMRSGFEGRVPQDF